MFHFPFFVLTLALSVASLGGCASTITAIFDRPIVEHDIEDDDPVTTIALKADRRLVIFNSRKNDSGDREYIVVSEPSPDAYAELAALLQFESKAKASGFQTTAGKIDLEGLLKLEDKISTRLQRLGVRSQGLSFFRDGSFRLAEAYMNEVLDNKEYIELLKCLFKQSSELIEFELKGNPYLAASKSDDDPTDENGGENKKNENDLKKSNKEQDDEDERDKEKEGNDLV